MQGKIGDMENSKWNYIVKPIWRWIVTIPIGLITAYDLYRQQINPNAPLIIDWLPNIQWFSWLLFLLLVIALIIIEGLWRHNKAHPETSRSTRESKQIEITNSQKIAVGNVQHGGGLIVTGDIAIMSNMLGKLSTWTQ